ncbi:hypothetical protein GCM10009820_14480 [Leifsonia soli]
MRERDDDDLNIVLVQDVPRVFVLAFDPPDAVAIEEFQVLAPLRDQVLSAGPEPAFGAGMDGAIEKGSVDIARIDDGRSPRRRTLVRKPIGCRVSERVGYRHGTGTFRQTTLPRVADCARRCARAI